MSWEVDVARSGIAVVAEVGGSVEAAHRKQVWEAEALVLMLRMRAWCYILK